MPGYVVNQWVVGTTVSAGSVTSFTLSNVTANHTVTVSFILASTATTLSVSQAHLAASVSGYTEYGVVGTPTSGAVRTITVTNTGLNPASGLTVVNLGTAETTNCPEMLNSGDTCTITVTPGASNTSTSNCASGIAPTPARTYN